MRIFFYCLVIAAAGVVSWLLFIFIKQRKKQYAPTHNDAAGMGNSAFKPWKSSKGNFLGYLHMPNHKPNRVVLLFHGSRGEALDRSWLSELMPDESSLIFLMEYPGYGARSGKPTERNIFEAAWEAACEIHSKWNLPITVLGEGLGTGPACWISSHTKASEIRIDRLALISPFTSASDLAVKLGCIPLKLLYKDKMDAVKLASTAKVPLHIAHGTLDELVPIEMGRQFYKRYPIDQKAMTEIFGYGHSNINLALIDSPLAESFRSFVRGQSLT